MASTRITELSISLFDYPDEHVSYQAPRTKLTYVTHVRVVQQFHKGREQERIPRIPFDDTDALVVHCAWAIQPLAKHPRCQVCEQQESRISYAPAVMSKDH